MLEAAEDTSDLPAEAIETRWLGFPGATEAQLGAAEIRLGVTLPPSYREFLKITNGWRQPDAFWPASAGSLWATEQLERFSEQNQDWIDAYAQSYQAEGHLQSVLAISDEGDGIYLLNPNVIDEEGEWEAWFFANWNPGADRYKSFWEMMQAMYASWKNYLPLYKGEMTEDEYTALGLGRRRTRGRFTFGCAWICETGLRGDVSSHCRGFSGCGGRPHDTV